MSFEFTEENIILANKEIEKYPKGKERSAVMALLKIAQKQNNNFLSRDIFNYIANYLNIPSIMVEEVATFYTMYNLKPVGKYHVQICSNVVCHAKGSKNLLQTIEEVIGTKIGETSQDNMFTLSKVECLGACANAPVLQINDYYLEDVNAETIKKAIQLLNSNQELQFKKIVKAPHHLLMEINNVTRKR